MRTRRTTNPNQLALWGRYELEDLAVKGQAHSPAEDAVSSAPDVSLTVAEPARLAPTFRPAANLAPSFSAADRSTHGGPSARQQAGGATVIKFQAVYRPSDVEKGRNATERIRTYPCRSGASWRHPFADPVSAGWSSPTCSRSTRADR